MISLKICHRPLILVNVDILEGRRIICWRSIISDIKNADETYEDELTYRRQYCIQPETDDLRAFISECLKLLLLNLKLL